MKPHEKNIYKYHSVKLDSKRSLAVKRSNRGLDQEKKSLQIVYLQWGGSLISSVNSALSATSCNCKETQNNMHFWS